MWNANRLSASGAFAVALVLGMAVRSTHGQAITGRLLGTIQDSSHAAIPDARVTISNQDTGIVTIVTSDSHGNYIAPSLPSGRYTIKLLGSGIRLFDNLVPPGTTITERYGGGDSFYHALQVKVSKRYSGGMAFLFSYTYSKNIDTDAGGNPGSVSQGVYYLFDNRLNRGPANIDLRHNFVGSYIYDLPFGRKRRWLTNSPGIVNALFGG